jgi:hypothetical protein
MVNLNHSRSKLTILNLRSLSRLWAYLSQLTLGQSGVGLVQVAAIAIPPTVAVSANAAIVATENCLILGNFMLFCSSELKGL